MLYGVEEGRWVVLGPTESIDPGSGTMPAEYLAAVREDVGGTTLRRITSAMTGLTTRSLPDGSTRYAGRVRARELVRKTGFKEGRTIRLLPFGYVANGAADDPDAQLDAAITVGADGVVREVAVRWGAAGSGWTYAVTYDDLDATAAPVAPADARPLRDVLRRAAQGSRAAGG